MRDKRADRRSAILQSALEVFARDGYADASVDDIARAAGVAKPTIYNHFGDKQALFLETIRQAAAESSARVQQVIDGIDVHPEDLRAELEDLGVALAGCLTDDHGIAVMRLQLAETLRFPGVLDSIRNDGRDLTADRLAGKFGQLVVSGQLKTDNPGRAARHFMALVQDEVLQLSGYGSRKIAAEDVAAPVREGVDTFLAAFGAL